jgi:hypothetical protein
LCSFLQPAIISSLFGPNILLSTLFKNKYSVTWSDYNWRSSIHKQLPIKWACPSLIFGKLNANLGYSSG